MIFIIPLNNHISKYFLYTGVIKLLLAARAGKVWHIGMAGAAEQNSP